MLLELRDGMHIPLGRQPCQTSRYLPAPDERRPSSWDFGCIRGVANVRAATATRLPPPDQRLTANQLDDLVAPIALYPDELESQIMVSNTSG